MDAKAPRRRQQEAFDVAGPVIARETANRGEVKEEISVGRRSLAGCYQSGKSRPRRGLNGLGEPQPPPHRNGLGPCRSWTFRGAEIPAWHRSLVSNGAEPLPVPSISFI